jgi:hypothetical protein
MTAKTQVAPKEKINIPKMELVAPFNSVRLARKVREALKIPIARTRYFTDSSAVLGMLRTESGRFTEFVEGQSEQGESEQQCGGVAVAPRELQHRGLGNTLDRHPPETWTLGWIIRRE